MGKEGTKGQECDVNFRQWGHWFRRLEYSERFGILLDGKLIAVQEIRA
jgi:hypothetical protein